LKNDEVIDF